MAAIGRLASPTPMTTTTDGGYPWHDGELLYAADLNAAIAYSAGVYDIRSFGAKSDGATDDSAALNTAIATAIAAGGGKVVIPAGRTVLFFAIAATIPAGVTLTIEGMGAGASELYFSAPTDGLTFSLLNSGSNWGGVHLRAFNVIRGPTSPVSANTGISISIPSGPMYGGNSSLRDLVVRGSVPMTNQWTNSVVLAGISGTSVDNVVITGRNSIATDGGDVLLSLSGGPASNQFGVSYNIVNCNLVGGSAGINVSGWVQGVFIANSTVIGQYDSIRWTGGGPFAAEEMAVTNSTLNAGHRGFYVQQVNQCAVSGTSILHFDTGVAAGWAGVELNASAYCAVTGNNIVGAHTGSEVGILLANCGFGCGNAVAGNAIVNISPSGNGIYLQGTTAGATVVGNCIIGGSVNGIIQDGAYPNTLVGNTKDGTELPSAFYKPIAFAPAGGARWFLGHDGVTESGGNTGNNFEIVSASDTGVLLGAPLTINRASGIVTVQAYGGGATHLGINAVAGAEGNISYSRAGAQRWFVGITGTDSGSNTGSDFEFVRVSDAGGLLGAPLVISRATGALTITVPLNAANDAAAASAGVPVGGVYRNGSAMMVRVV